MGDATMTAPNAAPVGLSYAEVLREASETVTAHSTCPSENKPRFVAAARETVAALLGLAALVEEEGLRQLVAWCDGEIADCEMLRCEPRPGLVATHKLLTALAAGFDPQENR